MAIQMSITMRTLAMSGLKERYPNETDLQLKVRLAELLHSADVAKEIGEKLKEFQQSGRRSN